jgi:hypothetical protein
MAYEPVNQQWFFAGAIPRLWLRQYNRLAIPARATWSGLVAADRRLWQRYSQLVEEWPSWAFPEWEMICHPSATLPPQVMWSQFVFAQVPSGSPGPVPSAPVVVPYWDSVSLVASTAPPAVPAPLAAHVDLTWSRPGAPPAATVYAIVWCRAQRPRLQSVPFWKKYGLAGVVGVTPGVTVRLDSMLVSAGVSGSSPESWIRVALYEWKQVPFFVGEQVRGSWFL